MSNSALIHLGTSPARRDIENRAGGSDCQVVAPWVLFQAREYCIKIFSVHVFICIGRHCPFLFDISLLEIRGDSFLAKEYLGITYSNH